MCLNRRQVSCLCDLIRHRHNLNIELQVETLLCLEEQNVSEWEKKYYSLTAEYQSKTQICEQESCLER